MTSQKVTVQNKIGFHARPAAMLIRTADGFQSDIRITKGDKTAVAKSIINLLALRVKMNDEIVISADGTDEQEAVKALVELVNSRFGEE